MNKYLKMSQELYLKGVNMVLSQLCTLLRFKTQLKEDTTNHYTVREIYENGYTHTSCFIIYITYGE